MDDHHPFTVLSQSQTIAQLPDDTYGNVVRIKFRTAGGVVGQVDVDTRTYTKDVAVAAITEQAKHLDEVQAI